MLIPALCSTVKNIFSGTKDFKLEISYDQNEWTLLTSGTLPSALDLGVCDIPINTYETPAHGRYFRFTAVNYYGKGSGINYLDWQFLY